jgi:hypothetical protein
MLNSIISFISRVENTKLTKINKKLEIEAMVWGME